MAKWKYKRTSDERLMTLYARGHADAFEYLYLRHKSALFVFLHRQCNNKAIVEELAHDTWLAVIRRARHYKADAKFKTWLFSIAHNRLVDYFRKQGSSAQLLLEELRHQTSEFEEPVLQAQRINELINGLDVLPAEQLEAILLKIEGFSYLEIAEITGSKKETVKSRLRYATKHLRVAQEITA